MDPAGGRRGAGDGGDTGAAGARGEGTRRGGPVALDTTDHGAPAARHAAGEIVLCATPGDIVRLRRADLSAALAWRSALREVMAAAVRRGLRITAMTREGSYVLTRATSREERLVS